MRVVVRVAGLAFAGALVAGAPAGVAVAAPADAADRSAQTTTTTLMVTPSTNPADQSVTITVAVTAATRRPQGSVTIRDGGSPIAVGVPLVRGRASVTTNALGTEQRTLTAEFTGAADDASSVSAPPATAVGTPGAHGTQAVVVTIPPGSLTMTTTTMRGGPRSAANQVADLVITDTRAGNLGFTAAVVAGQRARGPERFTAGTRLGFVDVVADQVPGNALRAADVEVVDSEPVAPGLGAPRVFARYPAGLSTGTVRVHGRLAVARFPSSATGIRHAARLTFTVV